MSPVVVDPVRLAPSVAAAVPAPPGPSVPFGQVLARHREPPNSGTARKPDEPKKPDADAKSKTPDAKAVAAQTKPAKAHAAKTGPAKTEATKKGPEADGAPDGAESNEATEDEVAGDTTDVEAASTHTTTVDKQTAKKASGEESDDIDRPDPESTPDADGKPMVPVKLPTEGDAKSGHEKPAADGKKPSSGKSDADPIDPALAGVAIAAAPAATAVSVDPSGEGDAVVADVKVGSKPAKAAPSAPSDSAADAAAAGEKAVAVQPRKAPVVDQTFETDVDPDAAAATPALATDPDKPDEAGAIDVSALAAVRHEKVPAHLALPAVPSAVAASVKTVAEANVDHIVTSVRGELLTKGGTMDIRLDPPTLGTINVSISVDNGVLSASIQTTSDEATRLLSHNLTQLKTTLESAGVSVEHIQVKQAAPATSSNSTGNGQADPDARHRPDAGQDQPGRQEQQRREMLQRMWAKLAGEPLDLVA